MSILQDVLYEYMDKRDYISLHNLLIYSECTLDLSEFKDFVNNEIIPVIIQEINDCIIESSYLFDEFCTNLLVQKERENINVKIFGLDLPRKFSSKKEFYHKFRKIYETQLRSILLSCYPQNEPLCIKILDTIHGNYVYYYPYDDNIEDIMKKIVIYEVEEAFNSVDVDRIFSRIMRENMCLKQKDTEELIN